MSGARDRYQRGKDELFAEEKRRRYAQLDAQDDVAARVIGCCEYAYQHTGDRDPFVVDVHEAFVAERGGQ